MLDRKELGYLVILLPLPITISHVVWAFDVATTAVAS